MIVVNGVRYITQKMYSDISDLHASRISQLKKEKKLPFEFVAELGKELINYDELELSAEVRAAADLKFSSLQPLATYTLEQQGDYFMALISRLSQNASKANQLLAQSEQYRENLKEDLRLTKLKLTEQEEQLELSKQEIVYLKDKIITLESDNSNQKVLFETDKNNLKDTIRKLTAENEGLNLALNTVEGMINRTKLGGSPFEVTTEPTKKQKLTSSRKSKSSKE